MPLPRMRMATDIVAEIKAKDPNTRVTLYYVRQLIHEKKIPVLEVGRKKLVDMDVLLAYIAKGTPDVKPEAHGGIRSVDP